MRCAGYRKSRDFCGQTHSIRTVILEELILENLREIVSFASRSKDEFVEKIIVHAASDPKGKNWTQEIDIYYKGIGALEMSEVMASMEK